MYLTSDDILPRLKSKVSEMMGLYDLSYDDTLILFNYFKWNSEIMDNKYFVEDPNVCFKEISGVKPKIKFPVDKSENPICTICYEKKPKSEFSIGSCGHSLCKKCWSEYVLFMVLYYKFYTCSKKNCF